MDRKASCLVIYETKDYRLRKTLMVIKMKTTNTVECMHSVTQQKEIQVLQMQIQDQLSKGIHKLIKKKTLKIEQKQKKEQRY